ncbi:helix-turn-helix transcriptional regulator [Shewanella sp.]|uniref:helix-turn-helix transcriptional regulator n=1 Tax=Shewanella sp. TaxID=50422 RepID=UPI003A978ECA
MESKTFQKIELARSQFCAAERQLVLSTLKTVVELLEHVLSNNVEVVLHDMTLPESSVIALANGHVTGRALGDSILAGPKGDVGFTEAFKKLNEHGDHNSVIASYHTVAKSGLALHSSTAIFRDSDGIPYAALCFNSDMTIPQAAYSWLSKMLNKDITPISKTASAQHQPAQVDTLMEDIIDSAINAHAKPLAQFSKEDKIAAVATMQSNGIFVVRGGVNRAAKALGVTRFTIYNYLDELKKRSQPN